MAVTFVKSQYPPLRFVPPFTHGENPMKSLRIVLCLVVLCGLTLFSGCTDNKALQEIRDQMQAEKKQKEIDARADELVRKFMVERADGLQKVRDGRLSADSHISSMKAHYEAILSLSHLDEANFQAARKIALLMQEE